jgi:hypothetical protein
MRGINWLITVVKRMASVFRRDRYFEEMQEEMDFHVAEKAEKYIRAGMNRSDAFKAAEAEFGNRRRFEEQSWHQWAFTWEDEVIQDVRFAIRSIARSRAFSAAVILTLALAIGANTAIFPVVYGVLLRPLPYPDPDRLVQIYSVNAERGRIDGDSSIPDYLDWKERATSFEAMEAFLRHGVAYVDGDRDRHVALLRATPGFLDLVGA